MLFLFDCDGVLVDSEVIAAKVDAEFLSEFGAKLSTEDIIHRYAGLTFRKIIELVEKDLGHKLPDDLPERQRVELNRRLESEVTAVSGIEALLDELDGERCICSNSSSHRLKLTLGRTNLYERFAPHIYSALEVGEKMPKPSPSVYTHAAEQFGIPPRECLVIEDSLFGITAAREAGMRVVGFTGGGHTWQGHADLLTEAGAETVIKRFAELPKVAEALMAWDGLPD